MQDTRVLIVDDEEQVRRSLVRLLERQGCRCAAAADAEGAAAALREQEFELVLCDVRLPGESGMELASWILAQFADTAVIMVTAVDDPALASVAIDAGASGYIVKPFTPNEVLINVANALRRRRLEIENRAHREDLVDMLRRRTEELWETIMQVEKADRRVEESFEEVIRRLSLAAEMHDEETARHIDRMSRYSGVIAERLGLGDQRSRMIMLAARMHDVGKIGIPDRILRKPGRFTPEEFEVMKQHAELGYRVLAGSGSELMDLAAGIARTHHERWDGTGYPQGLRGEEIPTEGRIAAVSDAFDALTSDRRYRPAVPVVRAVEVIQEARGAHFDPAVVDTFVDGLDAIVLIMSEPNGSKPRARTATD